MSTGADAPTVEEVWRELHDRLLGFISRRVRRPEDAEDILQEVMLRIHRHGHDLEGVDRVTSWVYRITSNAITDYYRKPARRELPSGEATEIPEPVATAAPTAWPEPEAGDLRAELSSCLRPFTARLPENYGRRSSSPNFRGSARSRPPGASASPSPG